MVPELWTAGKSPDGAALENPEAVNPNPSLPFLPCLLTHSLYLPLPLLPIRLKFLGWQVSLGNPLTICRGLSGPPGPEAPGDFFQTFSGFRARRAERPL